MNLNIYCGLRSIGWLITENSKVVQYGIKRLNISFDNYYEFIAGLPVSKRINRRQKRTARRNLQRYKRRNQKLSNLLTRQGFREYENPLSGEEILELRSRATKETLDYNDLRYVFLAISRKRGYKSMRGASMDDNSDYLQTIAQHEENLKNFHCVADYFKTMKSLKDVVLLRETYEKEFFQICKMQELDEDFVKKLHKIIFFQRPIKQNNMSYCKYEKGRKVMHASNPEFQVLRSWRDANNITIWDSEENELEIPFEMREKWANDLYVGKNITKASVCKDLGIKKSASYSWLSGKSLVGFELNKICKNLEIYLSPALWQDLFSATDNNKLEKLLLTKYQLKKEQVDILLDYDIHSAGWSEFSAKAVKKLTDNLKEGQKLSEAILEIYGKADFKEVALRNLILEQHFYSAKSLVEKLKAKYPISEMKFEIDTMLKMGNKMRKSSAQERRKDFALKKKYAAELEGKTDYEFQKLKAWLELQGPKGDLPAISPLEPNHVITLQEALSDEYNFDHIVPKSKLFERSPKNLILCRKSINEAKKRDTGFDFARKQGFLEDYLKISENFSASKKAMLQMPESEIPENAVSSRQNADYNTKCFSTLFENSVNIPNKVINLYLREWFENPYPNNDARSALQKAFVLANFKQFTIDYLDKIKESHFKPYNCVAGIEKPDFENAPIFLPRPKFTRKTGKKINPRVRLHEETVFGKIKIDGEDYFRGRKPILAMTDHTVKNIIDKALREFVEAEIKKHGSLENAKEKWTEQFPVFLGKELKSVSYKVKSQAVVPIKMKDGVLCDYVYPDAKHRLEIAPNGKTQQVTLLDLFQNIKDDIKPKRWNYLQPNSIVEKDGEKYFMLGVSEAPMFRKIYDLDATPCTKGKCFMKGMKKLLVNELGEIKKEILIL